MDNEAPTVQLIDTEPAVPALPDQSSSWLSFQTFAFATLVAASFLYIYRTLSKPQRKKYLYAIETPNAKPVEGEGLPRRNASVQDQLTDKFPEGVSTLHEILDFAVKKNKDLKTFGARPLIKTIDEDKEIDGEKKKFTYYQLGPFNYTTVGSYAERTANIAAGLVHLGMNTGDKLGIFEETRIEWTLAAQAAFRQNMSILTVYGNLGEEALVYALNLGEVKYLATNAGLFPTLLKIVSQVPTLKTLIYFDKADDAKKASLEAKGLRLISLEEVEKTGKENPVEPVAPKPSDVAVCMFTSGTTGNPKGVVLTHRNVVAAIASAAQVLEKDMRLGSSDYYLSFLPLAHILAFVVHYAAFYLGVTVGFGSPRTLTGLFVRNCLGDLKELKPTVFIGVPTVFEKLKKAILKRVSGLPTPQRLLFQFAYQLKTAAMREGRSSPLLDKFVFSKMRDEVGGRVRFFLCGGAYLAPDVQEFVQACFGAIVLQGYGLTETCGPTCLQDPRDTRIGSVGAPIPSVEIKLLDFPEMGYTHEDKPLPRGEVLIRGPSVATQYYKNPEETEKAFKDGWFRSGDIAQLTEEGTLIIIDRVKNLVKPPHGEYIAIEKLESAYRGNTFVEQLLIHADSAHYDVVAIVVPQREVLEKWASENGVSGGLPVICKNEKTRKAVLKSLQETARTKGLKSIEAIRSVVLTPEEWTTENGMLTAASKIKRKPITDKHAEDIKRMFSELGKDE